MKLINPAKSSLLLLTLLFCGAMLFSPEKSFGEEQKLKVVMLGDSLTAGGTWAKALPGTKVHNLGIGGNNTLDILKRLPQVITLKPNIIFLQAGINDLGPNRNNPGIIVERHLKIWAQLEQELPQTRLFITGLLPVKPPAGSSRYQGWNSLITQLNIELKKEAEARGLTFIDLTGPFSSPQGSLRADFTYDGIHLTPAAYKVWGTTIQALLPSDKEGPEGARQLLSVKDKGGNDA